MWSNDNCHTVVAALVLLTMLCLSLGDTNHKDDVTDGSDDDTDWYGLFFMYYNVLQNTYNIRRRQTLWWEETRHCPGKTNDHPKADDRNDTYTDGSDDNKGEWWYR